MSKPKHKIFFGVWIPGASSAKPGLPTPLPCWTWDSETFRLDSEKKHFDCDFAADLLASKTVFSSGYTWDQEDLKFDNNVEIFY